MGRRFKKWRPVIAQPTDWQAEILRLPDQIAAAQLKKICSQEGPGKARHLAHEYMVSHRNKVGRTLHVGRLFIQYTSMIVESHFANRNTEAALSILKPALVLCPRSAVLHRNLAYLELKRGNKLIAENHAALACACDPDNARAAVLYADILRLNKHPEQAFDFLYSRAVEKFDHAVMMGLRRLVAETEIGRSEYQDLVRRYYSAGVIPPDRVDTFQVRHDAGRADKREIRRDQRGLDPRRLRPDPSRVK